jgi:hypothetical protein
VSHTLPDSMKKTFLLLVLAWLTLASAHGQVLRSGLMSRHVPRHGGHSGRVAGGYRGQWHGDGHYGYANGHWHGCRPFYAHPSHHHYGYGYPYGFVYAQNYSGYPSSAATGLWLGALAGGIIGYNSGAFGHHAWPGAVIGAGAGWLIGSAVDANRRAATEAVHVAEATQPTNGSVRTEAAQAATVAKSGSGNVSPMASVNVLFGRN